MRARGHGLSGVSSILGQGMPCGTLFSLSLSWQGRRLRMTWPTPARAPPRSAGLAHSVSSLTLSPPPPKTAGLAHSQRPPRRLAPRGRNVDAPAAGGPGERWAHAGVAASTSTAGRPTGLAARTDFERTGRISTEVSPRPARGGSYLWEPRRPSLRDLGGVVPRGHPTRATDPSDTAPYDSPSDDVEREPRG